MVLLRELPAECKIAPPENPKENAKNVLPRETFLERFRNLNEADIRKIELRKQRQYYFDGKTCILYMQCPVCQMYKEATTNNFYADDVTKNNGTLETWFERFPHSFRLGPTCGCHQCFARKALVRNSDVETGGLAKKIMHNYPQLFVVYTQADREAIKKAYKERTGKTLSKVPKHDSGVGWMNDHLGKTCWASGFTLNSTLIKSHPMNPSPNGLNLQERGTYSRDKGHSKEETVAVCKWAQVQQNATNIPNLQEAYKTMYREIIANARKSEEELRREEDEAMRTIRTPYSKVIGSISKVAKREDKKNGRGCDIKTSADVGERLKKARMRCHTSGVMVSDQSGWNKAHFDRIDNALGHVDENMEMKCYLFGSECRLTRAMFLRGFLEQQLVPIPEDVRHIFEDKLKKTEEEEKLNPWKPQEEESDDDEDEDDELPLAKRPREAQ